MYRLVWHRSKPAKKRGTDRGRRRNFSTTNQYSCTRLTVPTSRDDRPQSTYHANNPAIVFASLIHFLLRALVTFLRTAPVYCSFSLVLALPHVRSPTVTWAEFCGLQWTTHTGRPSGLPSPLCPPNGLYKHDGILATGPPNCNWLFFSEQSYTNLSAMKMSK
jgi:hypothetical protein